MDMKANEKIYSTIIGGCTVLGTGVGFFLFFVLSSDVFAFVGSIMLGAGIGSSPRYYASSRHATNNHSPIGYTAGMDLKSNEKIYSIIIGSCTMLGIGVGLFLFNISVFAFVGATMLGTGVGLIVTALMRLS